MALPNISIDINRSGLGQVALSDDNIMGMILHGSAVSGKMTLGTPITLYGVADAEANGIDATNNPTAYKQVSDFYAEAGNGAKLYVIVSGSAKMSEDFSDMAVKLAEYAGGKISVLGVTQGLNQGDEVSGGLNSDVATAITAAQSFADNSQKAIRPLNVVLDGCGYTGNAEDLTDLTSGSNNRVSVLLGSKDNSKHACIGLLMGRLASIPVQRKISRVKDGAVAGIETAYLTDGEKIEGREATLDTIHDKGYIVLRQFTGLSGWYFSSDVTATDVTDDLNTISHNRIIDKVIRIAYKTYVNEIDDDVEIDADRGTIDATIISYLKGQIETQVNGNMTDEVSKFHCEIDADQNILSGLPLQVRLFIVPKGYLSNIHVNIGFTNPLA
jgi:hypothetical protein